MARSMFESLRIDFSEDPIPRSTNRSANAMDMDDGDTGAAAPLWRFSSQPNMPAESDLMDWGEPDQPTEKALSSTQPISNSFVMVDRTPDYLEDEPSMSQFSQRPSVPLSRTQAARQFFDIVPARPMTRFFSTWELRLLAPLICEAFHRLGVPVSPPSVPFGATEAAVRVSVQDGRMCMLHGKVVMKCVAVGFFEVEFVKRKGDPLEWRRFFKRVVILCKDAVCKPDD